jgi:hypothetical protein
LQSVSAPKLGSIAIREALKRAGLFLFGFWFYVLDVTDMRGCKASSPRRSRKSTWAMSFPPASVKLLVARLLLVPVRLLDGSFIFMERDD